MTTTQQPTGGRTPSMQSRPQFLQGVFAFEGHGLGAPVLLDDSLVYVVPHDREAQLVYFRGGNSSDGLVTVIVMRDGEPMRYFPIGARGAVHVPLRVVEDLLADTRIEIHVAAESSGAVVIDLAVVEI